MSLDRAFRLSGYLTLAAAVLCLAYSENLFLPEPLLLLSPALLLLAVACLAEQRGWVIPGWSANLLGVVITVAAAIGLVFFVSRPDDGLLGLLPLPAALLPYLGPFILALLLVKLVQPRTSSDHWWIQGLGLVVVILACVLADRLAFGFFLLAYLVCGTWHLAVFYLQREQARATASSGAGAMLPWSRWGAPRAAVWIAGASLLALAFFLIIPRSGETPWDPAFLLRQRPVTVHEVETGLRPQIDLNVTGTVELNNNVAFTVEGHQDADRTVPKTDLSPEQRWRGLTLEYYDAGCWLSSQVVMSMWGMMPVAGMPLPEEPRPTQLTNRTPGLPDLGEGQFYLHFTVNTRDTNGLYLAEPIVLRPGQALPVMSTKPSERKQMLFQVSHGTLLPLQYNGRGECRYQQVTVRGPEPEVTRGGRLSDDYRRMILRQPVAPLAEWANALLRRLRERPEPGLSADDFEPVDAAVWTPPSRNAPVSGAQTDLPAPPAEGMPAPIPPEELRPIQPPKFGGPPRIEGNLLAPPGQEPLPMPRGAEKIARALCDHLAFSGEYTYTLELRRHDPSLDPTLDFLRHVKQGHCERYATALALLLRTQGIPSRVILGFRGAEHQGDGHYVVFNSQAHSWVEALVPREGPDGKTQLVWLALDPTPAVDAPPRERVSLARLWERFSTWVAYSWRDFVMDFSPEAQQDELLAPFGDGMLRFLRALAGGEPRRLLTADFWLGRGLVALGLVPVGLSWWLLRRRGKRSPARVVRVAFYARLLDLLARHCALTPEPSQTPREFAETARAQLERDAATAALAGIPPQIAALCYRVCYGGRALTGEEAAAVDHQLDALSKAVTAR